MFSQIWKKYLPVIALLIKRSATAVQTLTLNHTDFERAAGGRKIKFSFTHLQLNKGRINTEVKHSPFAKEFSVVLQEDENIQRLLAAVSLEFSLNNQFLLTIRNTAPLPEEVTQTTVTEEDVVSADELATEEIVQGTQE
jgi:hypothetical protein